MQMIDRDIAKSSALVIDANPTSRGMLVTQLRDFGVGQVVQSSRIHDARRLLESRPFDIVLCEQDFEAEGYSGQNLLDDLRRLQLLPLSTVFIIVTGTASTTTVVDAAESAVDSYLLKPYTAAALAERLVQVRKRKKALADIFAPVEAGDLAAAARLCLKRFKEQGPFHAYAARLGAELLLRIGEPEAARKLNEMVLEGNASIPWARLGVARAQIAANQATAAARSLEALVADQPNYTDALDILGRLQVEQGDLSAAAVTYRRAAEITRGSIGRLQRHGLLAWYAGQKDDALKPLERAAVLGAGSRMFDPQALVLLACLRFEQRDSKGLQRALDPLQDTASREADAARVVRLADVAGLLGLAAHKQAGELTERLESWGQRVLDPTLDLETACNLLAVCATLAAAEVALPPGTPAWLEVLATRFASSRAATALLAGAAASHPPFAARVTEGQQAVAAQAERAVALALEGRPQEAIQALVHEAGRTLNTKFVDLARMSLQRHRERLDTPEALSKEIDLMQRALASGGALPPLGQASDTSAHPLAARASSPAPAPAR